ncbi:MAG: hypothetical protein J0H21_15170, partial [Rhizobiales bacterium]|nr:hypothetical protein [Hyphomicrobiales bacterium]
IRAARQRRHGQNGTGEIGGGNGICLHLTAPTSTCNLLLHIGSVLATEIRAFRDSVIGIEQAGDKSGALQRSKPHLAAVDAEQRACDGAPLQSTGDSS